VVPFEERKGMEREHTPEIDLTRCHHVLEEGNKFESSFLRLDTLFSCSPEGIHTLVVGFVD